MGMKVFVANGNLSRHWAEARQGLIVLVLDSKGRTALSWNMPGTWADATAAPTIP